MASLVLRAFLCMQTDTCLTVVIVFRSKITREEKKTPIIHTNTEILQRRYSFLASSGAESGYVLYAVQGMISLVGIFCI